MNQFRSAEGSIILTLGDRKTRHNEQVMLQGSTRYDGEMNISTRIPTVDLLLLLATSDPLIANLHANDVVKRSV